MKNSSPKETSNAYDFIRFPPIDTQSDCLSGNKSTQRVKSREEDNLKEKITERYCPLGEASNNRLE